MALVPWASTASLAIANNKVLTVACLAKAAYFNTTDRAIVLMVADAFAVYQKIQYYGDGTNPHNLYFTTEQGTGLGFGFSIAKNNAWFAVSLRCSLTRVAAHTAQPVRIGGDVTGTNVNANTIAQAGNWTTIYFGWDGTNAAPGVICNGVICSGLNDAGDDALRTDLMSYWGSSLGAKGYTVEWARGMDTNGTGKNVGVGDLTLGGSGSWDGAQTPALTDFVATSAPASSSAVNYGA